MKQMLVGLVAIVFALVVMTGVAQASEGTVEVTGSEVACEGVSLWKERNYRVTGRCEGLVYPYATQFEHYVLWAKTKDTSEVVRVADVERGYFDGNMAKMFTELFITAESDGLPRRPSGTQVASGKVTQFGFVKSDKVAVIATPAPLSESTGESMTVQNGASTATSGNAVGTVIGKIVRSLLIIIAVVIVLVIGTSLVFRRRGSVST